MALLVPSDVLESCPSVKNPDETMSLLIAFIVAGVIGGSVSTGKLVRFEPMPTANT